MRVALEPLLVLVDLVEGDARRAENEVAHEHRVKPRLLLELDLDELDGRAPPLPDARGLDPLLRRDEGVDRTMMFPLISGGTFVCPLPWLPWYAQR